MEETKTECEICSDTKQIGVEKAKLCAFCKGYGVRILDGVYRTGEICEYCVGGLSVTFEQMDCVCSYVVIEDKSMENYCCYCQNNKYFRYRLVCSDCDGDDVPWKVSCKSCNGNQFLDCVFLTNCPLCLSSKL